MVLALATYQLILAAIGYRKLPVIDGEPAFFTHRAVRATRSPSCSCSSRSMCLAVFGFEDDYALHGWPGSARGRGRGQGRRRAHRASAARFCPYLGVTLFALLAVTWFTVTPDFLAGED